MLKNRDNFNYSHRYYFHQPRDLIEELLHLFLVLQIQNHIYSMPSLCYKVPSTEKCHASVATSYMYVILKPKQYPYLCAFHHFGTYGRGSAKSIPSNTLMTLSHVLMV